MKGNSADSKLPPIVRNKGMALWKQSLAIAPSIMNHKVLKAAFQTFNMCHNIAGSKRPTHLLFKATIIQKSNVFLKALSMWRQQIFFMHSFILGTSACIHSASSAFYIICKIELHYPLKNILSLFIT